MIVFGRVHEGGSASRKGSIVRILFSSSLLLDEVSDWAKDQ